MIENGSVVVRKICLKFKDIQMDDSDDKRVKMHGNVGADESRNIYIHVLCIVYVKGQNNNKRMATYFTII